MTKKTIHSKSSKITKKTPKTGKTSKTPKTGKTSKTIKPVKKTRNTHTKNNKESKISLTSKPTILYSKDPITGEETLAATTSLNKEGVKSFAVALEKTIPPTYYKRDNGSEIFTMSQKRSLVIQSYKDMAEDRVKVKNIKNKKSNST
jgi:hypothetical protein